VLFVSAEDDPRIFVDTPFTFSTGKSFLLLPLRLDGAAIFVDRLFLASKPAVSEPIAPCDSPAAPALAPTPSPPDPAPSPPPRASRSNSSIASNDDRVVLVKGNCRGVAPEKEGVAEEALLPPP
jgi:hypothetical protein